MVLGSVLNPINSTIIAVTLIPIGDALGAPPSYTAWLVPALYLATALGQPVVGRLIDGLSPLHSGLVQIPLFLVAIGMSIVSGRRGGVRGKLLVGALGQIAACAVMRALTEDSPVRTLVLVALVFGVPRGLNNLALRNSVYLQADPERTASSAGLLRTFATSARWSPPRPRPPPSGSARTPAACATSPGSCSARACSTSC